MSHVAHLKRLGAPLKNARMSWGSVRARDGVVFLLVWRPDVHPITGDKDKQYVRITHHARYKTDQGNYGHKERLHHVDLIQNGRKCFMVMCQPKDPDAIPRTVHDFEKDDVRLGGDVIEHDGEVWIGLGRRTPVREIL